MDSEKERNERAQYLHFIEWHIMKKKSKKKILSYWFPIQWERRKNAEASAVF